MALVSDELDVCLFVCGVDVGAAALALLALLLTGTGTSSCIGRDSKPHHHGGSRQHTWIFLLAVENM